METDLDPISLLVAAGFEIEMSACTGISKMPAPVPVPRTSPGQASPNDVVACAGRARRARRGAQARAAGSD